MKNCIYRVVVIGSIISAVGGILYGQNIQPSPDEILQKFQKSMSLLPKKFAIEAISYVEMEGDSSELEKQKVRFNYYGDDNLLDVGYKIFAAEDEQMASPVYHNRAIIDNENRSISYRGQKATPSEVLLFGDGAKRIRYTRAQLAGGESLDGYFARDQVNIVELLNSSELHFHDNSEMIDGFECYAVEASTDHGQYTVWLDPQSGYLPRKVVAKKTGKDIFGHQPLSNSSLSISEVSYIMDSVVIKELNGIFIPIACSMIETFHYPNGTKSTITTRHERTKVDLNPDFESLGAFKPDIPDGTKVIHQDTVEAGIEFEWYQGKLVSHVEDWYLDELDAVKSDLKMANNKTNGQTATPSKEATKVDVKESSPITVTKKTILANKRKDKASKQLFASWAIFVSIGLLILFVCGWFIIRYYKENKHE